MFNSIKIGLLVLFTTYGCASTGQTFVQEIRIEQAVSLCKEYDWAQRNVRWKTADPSPHEVCTQLHRCAMQSHCRLSLPKWHYNPRRF